MPSFRDNPPNTKFPRGPAPHEKILTRYCTDQDEVQDVIAEMRGVIDEFDGRVFIEKSTFRWKPVA